VVQLVIYLAFVKDIEEHRPRGYLPVDINENNVTVLVDGIAYLFETGMERLVLGYYYRRKSVQKKYDKLYRANCRAKRRVLRKLKEREKKSGIR
jgi:hypothetical protein